MGHQPFDLGDLTGLQVRENRKEKRREQNRERIEWRERIECEVLTAAFASVKPGTGWNDLFITID